MATSVLRSEPCGARAPRRLVEESSLSVEVVLFAGLFLASLGLLGITVYRLLAWPDELSGQFGAHGVVTATAVLFAVVATFNSLRWCLFVGLSFAARCRRRRRGRRDLVHCPYVSIFVPCFNEGQTIEPALDSLLELDYPSYEIIVVDDGSTDDTFAKASLFEGRHGGVSVRVFRKPNGGKWSALNYAFRRSIGELVLCVDADSRLGADTLWRLMLHMEDPRVSAVAGQIRVRNREKLLTRLQALEYQMGNGAVRTGQGFLHTLLVVPGPAGLFRRCVLEEVFRRYSREVAADGPGSVSGPYEGDTFAEDFDLSLTILSLGGRIAYEPEGISYTKAPDRAFTLISQRYRWIRGSFQVLRKFLARSRRDPGSASGRVLAWLAITYLIDFTIAPVIYLLGLVLSLSTLAVAGAPLHLAGWLLAFLLVELSAAALFLSIHKDSQRLLAVVPLLHFYNGLLLNSAWVISVLDELRGSRMRW
ncbi:MAG: glycosyltransferase [Pirellulales bacterium]|nr:glycosyltransferase [Pirellulales bacterium]